MSDETKAETLTGFPLAKTCNVTFHGDIPVICITDWAGHIARYELSREQAVFAYNAIHPHVVRA
jgi:hypothetical protein